MEDVKLLKVDGRKHKRVWIRPRHRQLFIELQKPEHKGVITHAMRAIGYTPWMAKTPTSITQSQSWRALMEEYMPQEKLAMRHKELLDKRETYPMVIGRGRKKRVELVDRGPETAAVSRGLEMAYKLRGSFVAEVPPVPVANIYNLFYKPEVRASVSAFEEQLKNAIAHEVSNKIIHEVPADTGDVDAGSPTTDRVGDGGTTKEG